MILFDRMKGRLHYAVASLLVAFTALVKAQQPAAVPLRRPPRAL